MLVAMHLIFSKTEALNEHFTSVASKLGETLPGVNLDSLNSEFHPPVFDLKEITMQDIADSIAMLSNSQAYSDDGITSLMIKCARTELLHPLHYIFILSLNTACFLAFGKTPG